MKSISILTGKPKALDDEADDAKEMSALESRVMAEARSQVAAEVKLREAAEEKAEQHRIARQIAEQERDNMKACMANMENMMASERKLVQEQINRLTNEVQSLADALGNERSMRTAAEDRAAASDRDSLMAKSQGEAHKKNVDQLTASLNRANKELEKSKTVPALPIQTEPAKQIGGFDVVVTSRDLNGNLQGLRVKPIKEN